MIKACSFKIGKIEYAVSDAGDYSELISPSQRKHSTARKVCKYGVFSGLYFPGFGLNTEIHFVNLRIQFECGKIRTRKNSVFGHFSLSALKWLI